MSMSDDKGSTALTCAPTRRGMSRNFTLPPTRHLWSQCRHVRLLRARAMRQVPLRCWRRLRPAIARREPTGTHIRRPRPRRQRRRCGYARCHRRQRQPGVAGAGGASGGGRAFAHGRWAQAGEHHPQQCLAQRRVEHAPVRAVPPQLALALAPAVRAQQHEEPAQLLLVALRSREPSDPPLCKRLDELRELPARAQTEQQQQQQQQQQEEEEGGGRVARSVAAGRRKRRGGRGGGGGRAEEGGRAAITRGALLTASSGASSRCCCRCQAKPAARRALPWQRWRRH